MAGRSKRAAAAEPPVVEAVTQKVDANDYVVFIKTQPPGATRARAKAYGPVDRSTANARLQKERRAYKKANGTEEGFIGHALVLTAEPAEAAA